MQIFVKTLEDRNIALDVKKSDSVCAAKAELQRREGIPPTLQRSNLAGEQFEDSVALMDYNIQSAVTLHLALGLPGGVDRGPLATQGANMSRIP